MVEKGGGKVLINDIFLQVMEQQSRQPFMTICQVSTIDGSPRLERQVFFKI